MNYMYISGVFWFDSLCVIIKKLSQSWGIFLEIIARIARRPRAPRPRPPTITRAWLNIALCRHLHKRRQIWSLIIHTQGTHISAQPRTRTTMRPTRYTRPPRGKIRPPRLWNIRYIGIVNKSPDFLPIIFFLGFLLFFFHFFSTPPSTHPLHPSPFVWFVPFLRLFPKTRPNPHCIRPSPF